jgi:hypothetical protein
MILEQLDIVLIVLGGILIAVSFVMNIIGTKKINRFSEEINRLERLLSEGTVGKKEPSSSSRSAPDSSHNSVFDSSILPAAEIRTPDGKRKTRYRAPGLHMDKLGDIVDGAETAAPADSAVKSEPAKPAPEAPEKRKPEGKRKTRYRPPGLHIDKMGNIVLAPKAPEKRKPEGKGKKRNHASGLHIDKMGNIVGEVETSAPTDSAAKSKPAEPASKPEQPEITVEHDTPVQAFSAKTQKPEPPLKKTDETPNPPTPKPLKEAAETADLPEEEKALLKNYLNGPSDVFEETGSPPKPASRDSRPAKEEESEVMEVVESNQFSSVKRIQEYGLKPVEINPFDTTVQKIDFEKIYQILSGMKTGDNLILNFRDILFLIESEYQSLKQLYTKASNKNIILSIKNVSRELKNDILSRISRINFIP